MEKNTKDFALVKENFILLAIGFALIVIGFALMSGGGLDNPSEFYPNGESSQTPEIFSFRRLTLAPIVTLFGFAVVVFAIIANPDSKLMKLIFKK